MSSTKEDQPASNKVTQPAELRGALLEADEHVLSTLERDGSRRWLYPKLAMGSLWAKRRYFSYFLIAVFTLLPHLRIAGKPAILLDIPHRRFTILGFTFLPTDTLLLALLMVSLFLTIFLATALVGRVWCGWACPQTVYMEFLFRPIDRFFQGTKGKGGTPKHKLTGWRFWGRIGVYFVLCAFLAHTFLAYFVGVDELARWVTQSPFEHPIPFMVMAFTTGAMLFDFLFFREQLCMIACPYGRFQSVMLDRRSMIVAYDHRRGEPRKKGKRELPVLNNAGDCVDCHQCVAVCPTGIDIRNGLQMECINCTQCIDVCDSVMEKVGRPKGLIRYSYQDSLEGKSGSWFRPRIIIYPVILIAALTLFAYVFSTKQSFDVTLLRNFGSPFIRLEDGSVENSMRLKLVNRTEKEATYEIRLKDLPNATIEMVEDEPMHLAPLETKTFPFLIHFDSKDVPTGVRPFELIIKSSEGKEQVAPQKLLGPRS